MKTAGVGGPETLPCKLLADEIYALLSLVHSIAANQATLQRHGLSVNSTATDTSLLFDLVLIRAIDACQTYVAEALQLVYKKYPAAIGGSEQVDFGLVLRFDSIEELVTAVVEQKVHDLSYKSMGDLDTYVEKAHGFSLFVNDDQRQRASRLVDIRNVIVHNRGIVNKRFLDRQPGSGYKLGDPLKINLAENSGHLIFLMEWIADLDFRVIEKFSLASQPRSPRPKLPLLQA
jgi:hypothetical protein